MNLIDLFENISAQQRGVGQLPADFRPPQTSPQLSGPYPGRNATQGYLVGEGAPRVDSLVTRGLEKMTGPRWLDAVAAIKAQVGERDYRDRKQFYDVFVQQLVDMYGKKDVAEGWDNDQYYRSIINQELKLAQTDPTKAAMNLLQGQTLKYPLIADTWKTVNQNQDLPSQAKEFFQKLQTNLNQQGVAEGSSENKYANLSNRGVNRGIKRAGDDFNRMLDLDQVESPYYKTQHQQDTKQRLKTKPMAGPKGVLPEQGVAEGKSNYNFDIEDLKRLERIRDLPTLKAQALALISKPSTKPMKPEKVEWFKNALENMNSPIKVIKLMYDLMLSGEGHAVVGSTASMNPNTYRRTFGEQGVSEKLGDNRPSLGSKRDQGKIVRKWRNARGMGESGVAEGAADNNPMAAAVVQSILHGRLDLLQKYGAEAVLQAVEDVTDGDTDWEEIGSSDVSAYVQYVEQQLQDRMGSREEMNEAATTTEDVLSAMKKKLNDYLQNVADAIKTDPTLKDKLPKNLDQLKAIKTIRTDDGHEIKINGNEDDGFRVSIRNREMSTPFKSLDEAVMASEMYCARRRMQALEADYMEEN